MKVKEIQSSGQNISDAEFISLLTNIPLEEIRQATIPQINFVSKVLNSWFSNLTTKQPLKQIINYKGQMLGLTQPSQMSWGEFTDLEILASQEKLNLKHLAAILYRPCETFNVETLERKIVKYNYDECVERSKDMEDSMLYGALDTALTRSHRQPHTAGGCIAHDIIYAVTAIAAPSTTGRLRRKVAPTN